MAEHLLQGDPDIPLTLRRSARARRITLRISSLDGRVTLTLPRGVAEVEALSFAQAKEGWIRKHLAQQVEQVLLGFDSVLPIEGQTYRVQAGPGRSVRVEDDTLRVPGPPDQIARRVQGYLKARARDALVTASDHYAAQLGRQYAAIALRDTRSRWGSCSSAGRLMFSWRLIMAPPVVLAYVAAHEVAHLAEMNHSRAFWRTVERIHGPYTDQRHWLRTQGNALHAYRFGD